MNVAELALHVAAQSGNLTTVKRIVSSQACSPDCVSRYDKTTPFWVACCHGHLAIAEFLDRCCCVDKNRTNCNGQTPLSVACEQGHLSIVQYLVQRHPKCVLRDLDLRDSAGRTPFWYACENGHLDVARFLHSVARYHFNPNRADARGRTVLHRACESSNGSSKDVLDFLLNECDSVVDVNKPTNPSGLTALHMACRAADDQLVQRLLRAGAHVTVEDRNRNTPLHYAVQSGSTAVVDFLVAYGARLDACNAEGLPPFLMKTSKPEKQVNMLFHLLRGYNIGPLPVIDV